MQQQVQRVEYQIVHAIPGRIRIKIPALGRDRVFTGQLQQLVMALPGIENVRINDASESIVISYSVAGKDHEKVLQDTQVEVIQCIQKAGEVANIGYSATVATSPPTLLPSSTVSTIRRSEPATQPASRQSSNDVIDASSTPGSSMERIESDVVDIFDALGVQLPDEYFDLSQLAVDVDQVSKVLKIGLPVEVLLSLLQSELDSFASENEKTEAEEHIQLDLKVSSLENGFLLQGKARGQFRKSLFTAPIIRRNYYTPWVEISAVGQAELMFNIVDETLQVEMKELQVSGDPGEWQEKLVEYAFEHLFKDKVVARINETLTRYNGANLPNLFFQSNTGKNLLTQTQIVGLTRDRIDALLSFFKINVELTKEYIWFSIQF